MTDVPQVWIDVTDLLRWRQRKTGTQRVVHEVIAAYAALRPIRLFYFSPRLQTCFAVEAAEFLAGAAAAEAAGTVAPPPRPTSIRSVLRLAARRADFRRGDRVLILGGDWRRKGFLPELATLRARVGIQVHHFVHDVMPITTPHLFPPHETEDCLRYLARAFQLVDSVITSSRWNVDQIGSLVQAGRLADVPVHAVGLGTTSLVHTVARRPPGDLPEEFSLSVGTFELKVPCRRSDSQRPAD